LPDDQTVKRPKSRQSFLSRPWVWLVFILILGGGAKFGWDWWTSGRFIESTDDAYLAADAVVVAPQVSGYVHDVLVADNQEVSAGQPLVRIDPENYQINLERQKAAYDTRQAAAAVAEAQLQQQLAEVDQTEARLAGDRDDAAFAAQESARYKRLAASGAETAEKLADMVNQNQRANVTVQVDAAAVLSARRQADTAAAQLQQTRAQVEGADASIRAAELDVSHTLIRASIAGRVGDRAVRIGQYVQPGTRLLTLVPVQDIYVVANFKETQTDRIRIGEHASVSVDALDGRSLDAVVDSIAPGTGSTFALLPPENATGNFTKIVQRVPVRLRLKTDPTLLERLVPGLSVTVDIDTRGGSASNENQHPTSGGRS
jgi:membrane fusion protein, multidrug efflux system